MKNCLHLALELFSGVYIQLSECKNVFEMIPTLFKNTVAGLQTNSVDLNPMENNITRRLKIRFGITRHRSRLDLSVVARSSARAEG